MNLGKSLRYLFFQTRGGTGIVNKDVIKIYFQKVDQNVFEGKGEGNGILHLMNSLLFVKKLGHLLSVTTLGTLDQKMEFTHSFTQQMLLNIYYVPPLDWALWYKDNSQLLQSVIETAKSLVCNIHCIGRGFHSCFVSIAQRQLIQAVGALHQRAANKNKRKDIPGRRNSRAQRNRAA